MNNTELMKETQIQGFYNYLKTDENKFSPRHLHMLFEDTNEQTVIKILALFAENLLLASKDIGTAIASQDRMLFSKHTHKISGTAELLGFKQLAADSKKLTQMARADADFDLNSDAVLNYLKNINHYYSDIRDIYPNIKALA